MRSLFLVVFFFNWTSRNQFSLVLQTVPKSVLIGVETPLFPIPPMKRNLVACFIFDDFVILHLNGLTWSLPPPHRELGRRLPSKCGGAVRAAQGGSGKWAAPPWPPRRESCFCSSGIDGQGAERCSQGTFVLKNEPICWNYSDTFLQTKHKDFCVNIAFCSSFFLSVLLL